jgi:hypothetical protein
MSGDQHATVRGTTQPPGNCCPVAWGLEREFARKYDLQLVPDSAMRQFVLWSPISPLGMWLRGSHLSDDVIHPNKRATQYLAEAVAKTLVQMYGDRIRRGAKSE